MEARSLPAGRYGPRPAGTLRSASNQILSVPVEPRTEVPRMSRFDLTPEQAFLGATATAATPTETDPAVVYTIPQADPDCGPLPTYDPEARLREWEDERQRRKLQRENDRQAKRALL